MNKKEFDLNAPAFGDGAQKLEDLAKVEEPVESSVEEPVEEVKERKEIVESVEENKVPYSRFKKFHDLALKSQEQIEELNVKLESLMNPVVDDVPEFWKELYGDSETSIKAWKIQSRQQDELIERAKKEATNAVEQKLLREKQLEETNLSKIDDHLELVSAAAGRELTETEESIVLDIIDEFTPKNEDGSYVGTMISPEKAWEIYELKREAIGRSRKQTRDVIAGLTGKGTQGDPTSVEEQNKNWKPFNWSSWRDKLK